MDEPMHGSSIGGIVALLVGQIAALGPNPAGAKTYELMTLLHAALDPLASPVAPPESELDKEITRWQKAIYDLCREESGDDTIDGGGCDSGDPLDFTLAEISEAFGIIKDKLASPVAGGSARIAEIASRLAAITEWPWKMITVPFVDDAHGHTLTVPNSLTPELREADARFIAAAPDDIAYLLKLVPEGWVKVTPETLPTNDLPSSDSVIAALGNTEYARERIKYGLQFLTDDQKRTLFRAVLQVFHQRPPAAEEERVVPVSERFMRQHYGASGYVDPHVAYEAAHTEFDTYWSQQPPHLRQDDRYRTIAAKAYLAAKGFELGGARYQRAEREGI